MGDPAELTTEERREAMALADRIFDSVVNDEVMDAKVWGSTYEHDRGPYLSQIDEAKLLRMAQQVRDLRAALVKACDRWEDALNAEVHSVINGGGYMTSAHQPARAELAELLAIAEPKP